MRANDPFFSQYEKGKGKLLDFAEAVYFSVRAPPYERQTDRQTRE